MFSSDRLAGAELARQSEGSGPIAINVEINPRFANHWIVLAIKYTRWSG